jgi:cell surface protein SprA
VDPSQPQVAQLNEQSIVFKLHDLPDGDARVAYKNINLDLRQYKKLRMFTHAEALINEDLKDYDLTAFIRIGSDQTDNYYEVEVLLLTRTIPGTPIHRRIMARENLFEIDLESWWI